MVLGSIFRRTSSVSNSGNPSNSSSNHDDHSDSSSDSDASSTRSFASAQDNDTSGTKPSRRSTDTERGVGAVTNTTGPASAKDQQHLHLNLDFNALDLNASSPLSDSSLSTRSPDADKVGGGVLQFGTPLPSPVSPTVTASSLSFASSFGATSIMSTSTAATSISSPTTATNTANATNGKEVKSSAKIPSWQSPYTDPPPTRYPYSAASQDILDGDLKGVSFALDIFLKSEMVRCEEFMVERDKGMERLYFATGYGLIQCVKGLMSYEDEDLLAAIGHTKHGNHIASQHRKKQPFFSSLASSLPIHLPGTGSVGVSGDTPTASSSVLFIKGMTDVERHAELVYAESLFEKALLGIVYSGDWLAFIKEALNMRTTISVYRNLHAYVEYMDAVYASTHSSTQNQRLEDPSIDAHFRSGVLLGAGMCNIILSLLPGRLMQLSELFGYKGDRMKGLELLMRAGGWGSPHGREASAGKNGATDDVEDPDGPTVSATDEGVRRSICDMALLIFHLVLSSFTVEGVDVGVADRVLRWNLKRFPNGIFFLFGAGRLHLTRSQPALSISYYTRATKVQSQFPNLHHISYWEIAIARLALWELEGSLQCWRKLEKEASWSRAVYCFGLGACLAGIVDNTKRERLASGTDKKNKEGEEEKKMREEAARFMSRVPGLRQKIAGKSIPLEKFVARKARKFTAQNNHLLLPALELAYIFQAITHAPRDVILGKMLAEVEGGFAELGVTIESKEEGGKRVEELKMDKKRAKSYDKERGGEPAYWDDVCLALFLRGVCLRYIAYPDPDAEPTPTESDLLSVSSDDAPPPAPTPAELEEKLAYEALLKKREEEWPTKKAADASEWCFKMVFEYGPKIELDHHLVYHAHYELAKLLANTGDLTGAKHHLDLVASGKHLEVNAKGMKGRYSMENALHMRTNAALDALGKKGL
ncbi:hypothetical protein CVT24_007499 [Panaeolus cyanescens]|uniref:Tetratricopeptide repeat protein 39B n=1 Tax=Panaeolus cyanescens TaxID=181874 RepID=A0A409W9W0_9AGAR|nr:hypothetical protein CVT24_007499 [Panaeolus cyanescens]